MGAQHTPGPWVHHEDPDDRRTAPNDGGGVSESPFGVAATSTGVSIAMLWFGTDCDQHISREEAAANARLIAAAPDLLAFAKDFLGLTENISDDGLSEDGVRRRNRVRALVAKAEGRP